MNGEIKLLVSVKNLEEAKIALEAGVDCIDVKDPAKGSLGAASFETVEDIVQFVEGRTMVSAALGEYHTSRREFDQRFLQLALNYLKWGTSRLKNLQEYELDILESGYGAKCVAVAYADSHIAKSPDLEMVLKMQDVAASPIFMIDTYAKDGRSVFDHVSTDFIMRLRIKPHWKAKQLALAGSLKWDDFAKVKKVNPDWIAVRGLVCEDGDRTKSIDASRVERLKKKLSE